MVKQIENHEGACKHWVVLAIVYDNQTPKITTINSEHFAPVMCADRFIQTPQISFIG